MCASNWDTWPDFFLCRFILPQSTRQQCRAIGVITRQIIPKQLTLQKQKQMQENTKKSKSKPLYCRILCLKVNWSTASSSEKFQDFCQNSVESISIAIKISFL